MTSTSPTNTVYLVTGANRGLGLGLVKALLARPQATVIATARNDETAAGLRQDLSQTTTPTPVANGSRAEVVVLDLSTAPTPEQVLAAIPLTLVDRVDVLISNAGRMVPMLPIADAAAPDLRAAFETNAIAPLALFQALRPRLSTPSRQDQAPPKVIMVSSSVGCITQQEAPGGAYGASKAALNWITRALHNENESAGLVAVALHPGWVRTRAGEHAASEWGFEGELPETVEGSVRGMLEVIDGATRENVSGNLTPPGTTKPDQEGKMSDTTKLLDFLQQRVPSDGSHKELCTTVLPALVDAIADIARVLRASSAVAAVGTANAFGDDQLNVDVASEEAVRAALDSVSSVVTASSEEDPAEDDGAGEIYTVAFDPLDGSSIIAPNWSVGTILGVWRGASALHQSPKRRQVAAVLGVYGPRTTAVVALRIPGQSPPRCFEVAVGEQGADDSVVVRPDVKFADAPFQTRYFAPANLRAAAEDANYMKLVAHYIQSKYTLRYSGGLVPDVVHALAKGHGVYVSPVTGASKAKLRRLYELFPLALIVECAGGRAIDPATGDDILEHPSKDTDERAGLVCGTAEEVEFVKKSLLG
ncbi:uncharacterized protein PG986_013972 [Apiospora aurea]|uniref:Uncharacterized protein n=1 Tax=Apiospora aurea TaxID=335848 RepID=A0ABR1PY67_9PEZI